MDPTALAALREEFPGLESEYQRVRALGDGRTFEQWLQGFIQENPYAEEARRLDELNREVGSLPAEQVLGELALERALADASRDPARVAEAQGYVDATNRGYDRLLGINEELLDGRRLQAEMAQADRALGEMVAAAEAEAAERTQAIDARTRTQQMQVDRALGEMVAAAEAEAAERTQAIDARTRTQQMQVDRALGEMVAAAEAEAAERTQAIDARTQQMQGALAELEAEREALLAQAQGTANAAILARAQARISAIDAETAQLRQGITQLGEDRRAALEGVEAARIQAAEAMAGGVNQGLERTMDMLDAERMKQGFVGRSTMDTNAATRATMDARQLSAQTMADAWLANAMDRRGVDDEIAGLNFDLTGRDAAGRRGVADEESGARFDLDMWGAQEARRLGEEGAGARFGLTEQDANMRFDVGSALARDRRDAENMATGARSGLTEQDANMRFDVGSALARDRRDAENLATGARGMYFDNDLTRRLQAAVLVPQVEQSRLGLVGAADDFGYQGLRRGFDTLSWFDTGGAAPPMSKPYFEQPSQAGSDMAGLGAGLLQTGFNLWDRALANRTPTGGAGTGGTTSLPPASSLTFKSTLPPTPVKFDY